MAVAISAEARRLAASGLVPTDHVTQLDRRLTQVVATIDTMRLPAVPPLPHRIPGALPGPRPVIDVRRPHSPGLLRRVERGIEKKPAAA
ncbi:hypothetical protein [Allonocardiopsis opalescens]|uniref:hypothetical protein n=1 Tax=Allonocardiopsis opalescens TaxID=1144618 RepID=UPI0011B29640|nr:hypothetical protein [Allonocardiopsis opalescens]